MGLHIEKTDEALCGLVAAGNREAEECLATRYSRLVRACARPYFLAGGDSEDLLQEGMIGLLSAIRSYDPEEETLFRTYAEVCIRNRLRSAIRSAARDKHNPLNHALSFDPPLLDENSNHTYTYRAHFSQIEDPEHTLIIKEEQEARMKAIQNQLSSFEKIVLDLYLNGFSYTEIADQVGRSLKSVDNAIQRIRRKVAAVLVSGDISIG